MKILDLLELYDPVIKNIQTKNSLGQAQRNIKAFQYTKASNKKHAKSQQEKYAIDKRKYRKGIDVLGTGASSATTQKDSSPGEVIKISRSMSNDTNDGYINYIKAIIDNNQMQNNPYFPKIYSVKNYKDETGNKSYVVKLEKLYPLHKLTTEEFVMLIKRIFDKNEIFDKYDLDLDLIIPDETINQTLEEILINELENLIQGKITTKDDLLRNAMYIIKDIAYDTNIGIDGFDSNIMFRRTSVGPQLVISDPLS